MATRFPYGWEDRLTLSLAEAAQILGMTEGALREHIRRGTGPKALKVSARTTLIRVDDLKKWLEERSERGKNGD